MVVERGRGLRCAITDLGPASPRPQGLDWVAARRMRLERAVRQWAVDGVDIVQLREKGLESGELLPLAELAMGVLRELAAAGGGGRTTRLVVNGRADVAAAAGADGVHLTARAGELRPEQVREVFRAVGLLGCVVSVSCHRVAEVAAARRAGADLVLFGPVFEKRVGGERVVEGAGLEQLREACLAAGETPVLALGGVTTGDVADCLAAGAAGVAGIRLFG